MKQKTKISEFKKELKALLVKYKASIDFCCADCSDTYGIYEERISVTLGGDCYKEHKLTDGYGVDQSDL